MRLTYRGAARAVEARLAHGDRLVFHLDGFGDVGGLELRDLFWAAVRSNPAKGKHRLQPHTGHGTHPGKRGKKPDTHYAREYGVSSNVIRMWRQAGAPLANPDQMGDYIFTIKLRKSGSDARKGRKVVLR
jgi:hypothetical protein